MSMERISYRMDDDDQGGYQPHDAKEREILNDPGTGREGGDRHVNFDYSHFYQHRSCELRV